MPETFLILLAGGIMLAAAVVEPKEVTLQWLRLAGIIALCMIGLSGFFYARRESGWVCVQVLAIGLTAASVLGQLAFVQIAWRRTQRGFCWLAFIMAVAAGVELMGMRGMNQGEFWRLVAIVASAMGISAMSGLVLMDMLLGHAYLTASKLTIKPFLTLNLALAGVLVGRIFSAVGATMWIQHYHPVEMLWGVYGLYMLTRWLVGLFVPAVFVYMAHDCIKRRATQSATGILYVAGILVFIGEIVALHLVRETGLPF